MFIFSCNKSPQYVGKLKALGLGLVSVCLVGGCEDGRVAEMDGPTDGGGRVETGKSLQCFFKVILNLLAFIAFFNLADLPSVFLATNSSSLAREKRP